MAKPSEVSVSDDDRKTLTNLDSEIADRIKEFRNIMSKYVDVSIESHSNFGYSRKKVEGGPRGGCVQVTYIVHDTGDVYCYDDCRGTCYAGACIPMSG